MEIISKKKILFFGSGDFPVRTFKKLIEDGYEISGLITSKDRVFFENERLIEIAQRNNIPTYIPKTLDEPELLDWIDEHPADIFCVISYKFLKEEILSRAKTIAFNIHASLLPFLRGANPISWAIMNEFKETGLTAFVLNDKIDSGDILDNTKVSISEEDNYGSLYDKLAGICPEFTEKVIDTISADGYQTRIKQQDIPQNESDKILFTAPKIDSDFTTIPQEPTKAEVLCRIIKAITPKWSLRIPVNVYSIHDGERNLIKILDLNIYEAEVVPMERDALKEKSRTLYTDFKTKLYFFENRFEEDAIFIKKVQLAGKKVLDVEEFLRGIQYLNKPGLELLIEVNNTL